MDRRKKIYLDYAASTPVDSAVFRAMRPYFTEKFGNPGSLHAFGQEAIAAVDASRETIAQAIGADFREVMFTSSATEANNLALRGIVRRLRIADCGLEPNPQSAIRNPRIIVSSIEHESVLETARDLAASFGEASLAPEGREQEGVDIVYLPVDRRGIVDLKKLKESLNENTILVSVMHANNEIGTVQPIREISKIIKEFKQLRIANYRSEQNPQSAIRNLGMNNYPLFHSDCSQSFQFLNCDVRNLGIDLMTLSAHKIYGPKGAGVLYARQGTRDKGQVKSNFPMSHMTCPLAPFLSGGGQEFGLRSGTENVPAIVGFAKATEYLFQCSQEHWNREIADLRDYLWKGIKKICPKVELNGIADYELGAKKSIRNPQSAITQLPNLINVYFPNYDAQDLLTRFDLEGLAVSSGSACRSRATPSSYVIRALGYSEKRAKSSIRFSLGRRTTKEEIDSALKIIKKIFP